MRRMRFGGWEDRLRGSGYKITSPRETIWSAMEELGGHPNARELLNHLSRQHPDIGLTTVYRTLELFVRLGILKKFDFGDGRGRYEIIPGDADHHHHMICLNCLKVIEYRDFMDEEKTLIEKIQKKLEKKFNFEIHRHELEFYGLCRPCGTKP